MWGTLQEVGSVLVSFRFIPTHVGNTPPPSPVSFSRPVHPHACGEHIFSGAGVCAKIGSSPRMWGTHSLRVFGICWLRFIPTHVGNTPATGATRSMWSVHPHACGEHGEENRYMFNIIGSSPRMWGFIPTHVGNTFHLYTTLLVQTVHPHACGEHIISYSCYIVSSGSSPRMWGTLVILISCWS